MTSQVEPQMSVVIRNSVKLFIAQEMLSAL
jgi:hypothetical protein